MPFKRQISMIITAVIIVFTVIKDNGDDVSCDTIMRHACILSSSNTVLAVFTQTAQTFVDFCFSFS